MTTYVVSVGQFVSNLGHADTATILLQGSSLDITDGGLEIVSSGGLALATSVVSGQLVEGPGGLANRAAISAGGSETVSSGGSTSAETIYSGGRSLVLSGGYASSVTVCAGGVEQLSSGVAQNVSVLAGGLLSGVGVASGVADYGSVNGVSVGSSIDVFSGGVALNVIVSGLAAPGSYYHYGLFVSSGASATGTIVGSEGYLELDDTGSAAGTIVSAGGLVSGTGGVLTGATQNAGEVVSQTVSGGLSDLAGGFDVDDVIASGGSVVVEAGGSTFGDTVEKGAALSGAGVVYSLDDLGVVRGVSVGSSLDVSPGGVASGVTVAGLSNPGNYYHYGLFVSAGASVNSTIVGSAGYLELDGNGSALNTDVGSGGVLLANTTSGVLKGVTSDAGEVAGAIVSGTLIVLSGGEDVGDTLTSGAVEDLEAGGSTFHDVVDKGATLSGGGVVSSLTDFGTVSGVTIGSSLDVSSGGVAEGVIDSGLAAPGNYYHYGLFVSSGASATGTMVGFSGYLELDGNGSAANTTIASGGVLQGVGGGYLTSSTTNAGLVQDVTVRGTLVDLAGGYDNGDTVAGGGRIIVSPGGSANNVTVDAGGKLYGGGVVSAGAVFGLVSDVSVGSSLDIEQGGLAEDITISGLGAAGDYYHEGLFVHSGASASGTVVGSAGYLELDGNGSATDTVVSSGGYLSGYGGQGFLKGTTTNAGRVVLTTLEGALTDLSGGSDLDLTLLSGATDTVDSGATTTSVTVSAGAHLLGGGVVFAGAIYGLASGLSVGSSLDIESGGAAEDIIVSGLGAAGDYYHEGLFLHSGASATGTVVGSSGYLELDGNGSALNTIIGSGGEVSGYAGQGALKGTTMNAGQVVQTTIAGTLTDLSGATDSYDLIVSGGVDDLQSGAAAYHVTISSGGLLSGGGVVYSGDDFGTVSALIVGSSLDVSSGGVADGVTISGLSDPGDYYHYGLFVSSGGATSGDVVGAAGYLELDGTGSALATTVLTGGVMAGIGGGFLRGATTNAGVLSGLTLLGKLTDSAGGFEFEDVVAAGATDTLLAGAGVASMTVSRGGVLEGGGVVSSAEVFGLVRDVSVGSSIDVSSGGLADGVTVEGLVAPGNYYHEGLFISSAGSASGTMVGSGGYLEIDGGTAAATTIDAGASAYDGGFANGATVMSGADLYGPGSAGGLLVASSGATVSLGGVVAGGVDEYFAGAHETLTVSSGAVLALAGQVLTSGQTLQIGLVTATEQVSGVAVLSGATVELAAATIETGATLALTSGVVLSGLTVQSGASVGGPGLLEGRIVVSSGGMVSGGTMLASGAQVFLSGGGVASGVTIRKGAYVSGPGEVTGSTNDLGEIAGAAVAGELGVGSGGAVSNATILPGATVTVSSGGTLEGNLVLGGPVTVALDPGATVSAKSINEFHAGVPQSLTLGAGDTLELVDPVVSRGVTLTAGRVLSTITLSGVALGPGATLALLAPTVLAGGTVGIGSGAEVSGAVVKAGGALMVSSGGTALLPDVLSSGSATVEGEAVFSGSMTLEGGLSGSGTLVVAGGGDLVLGAASHFSGELAISSGVAELAGAGGIGAATVVFSAGASGGARLIVDAADAPVAGQTFASELMNFSQNVDSLLLAGLSDVSGHASAKVSGSTLVLSDGGKTYDFALGGQIASSFVVTAVSGGTLITADPSTQAHARLVQAMAAFAAPSPGAATGSSPTTSTHALIAEPATGATLGR